MCRYCKTLADLRREDLRHYESMRERYHRWFKNDVLLLRRCLIALKWKGNEELVEDILKAIESEE